MYGEAVKSKAEIATTVLAVMVSCLCGEPKFCIRLQPVKQLEAPFLKNTVVDCHVKQVLDYVAAYVAFKCFKQRDTADNTFLEVERNGMYLIERDKDQLTMPNDSVVLFVYYAYILFLDTVTKKSVPCHRTVYSLCESVCETYKLIHESAKRSVCATITNILLSNFARKHAPRGNESIVKVAKLANVIK